MESRALCPPHLAEYELHIILLINRHRRPELRLDRLFARLGSVPLEEAGLGDAGRHDGSLVPGHRAGDVTGGLVNLVHAELTALGQFILVAPEREGLSDVGPGPGELDGELLHGLGVLSGSLRCPHAGHGVASPLQGVDIAAVT